MIEFNRTFYNKISPMCRIFSAFKRLFHRLYRFLDEDRWFVLFYTIVLILPLMRLELLPRLLYSYLPLSLTLACIICLIGRCVKICKRGGVILRNSGTPYAMAPFTLSLSWTSTFHGDLA